MAKRKRLTRDDLLNWWLEKYHRKTIEQVIAENPKEALEQPTWFALYPVTKQQHDEWYEWAISALAKERRTSKKTVQRLFSLTYLDCAPYCEELYKYDSQHTI